MSVTIKKLIELSKKHETRIGMAKLKNIVFQDTLIAGHSVPSNMDVIGNSDYLLFVENTNTKGCGEVLKDEDKYMKSFSMNNLKDVDRNGAMVRFNRVELFEMLALILKRERMKTGDKVSISFHESDDKIMVSGLSVSWQKHGVNRFFLIFLK